MTDAVHFFDQRGKAILNQDHLERENARLAAENQRLREIIDMQQRRWKLFNPAATADAKTRH